MLWQAGGTDLRRDTQSPASGHSATDLGLPITPRRTWYRGTMFRSALEADWAATFDQLGVGWRWNYEPQAYTLPSGEVYCPDFWLPAQHAWFEVKGPHDERIHKTLELAAAVGEPQHPNDRIVVVGRPCEAGETVAHTAAVPPRPVLFTRCGNCDHDSLFVEDHPWTCRICWRWLGKHAARDAGPVPFRRARDERGG